MAITVQPVDGLIHRLLQQNGRVSHDADRTPQHAGHDRVSISPHARSQHESEALQDGKADRQQRQASAESARSGALESHLLELYRSHDGYGGS